jgi:HEPN domain-containing protein
MDEARQELTRRRLTKAAHDLQSARILSDAPGGARDVAIYHCQQAAEKAVKGYLISRDEPFPKIHEIAPLIRQAIEFEPSFETMLEAGHSLSPFAWQFRYPSEMDVAEPTRPQLDEALQQAQMICDFVLGLLPEQTHPSE